MHMFGNVAHSRSGIAHRQDLNPALRDRLEDKSQIPSLAPVRARILGHVMREEYQPPVAAFRIVENLRQSRVIEPVIEGHGSQLSEIDSAFVYP
jgi:hypothetical protein